MSLAPDIARASLIAACLSAPLHAAQSHDVSSYPTKPVRFIIPFAPGAGTDTTSRTLAQKLSEMWKHQVVPDNRWGAAGAIGVEHTANANPDGYTICLISASHSAHIKSEIAKWQRLVKAANITLQ